MQESTTKYAIFEKVAFIITIGLIYGGLELYTTVTIRDEGTIITWFIAVLGYGYAGMCEYMKMRTLKAAMLNGLIVGVGSSVISGIISIIITSFYSKIILNRLINVMVHSHVKIPVTPGFVMAATVSEAFVGIIIGLIVGAIVGLIGGFIARNKLLKKEKMLVTDQFKLHES